MRIAVLALLLTACDYGRAPDVAPPSAPTPAPVAEAPAPPAPRTKEAAVRVATVLETLDAGEYTYGRFDSCGDEAWAAGPKTAMVVGKAYEMPQGTTMADFHSPSLDRTFDLLLFVDWFKPFEGEIDCTKPEKAEIPPSLHNADPGAAPPPKRDVQGTVLETMESGGYRYARLKTCQGELWVAGPKIPIKVGDHIESAPGAQMTNFESKTLARTFASIQFVQSMAVAPTAAKCD